MYDNKIYNDLDRAGCSTTEFAEPFKETEYTKKIKDGFGFFGIGTFLYACFYTFCMFRNSSGITFPFFIAGSLLFFCLCLSKLEISLKKGSGFYMVSMILLAVSTFCTDDGRIILLNKVGIFLLMISLLLNQIYDTSRWELGKYAGSIVRTALGSLGELGRPFADAGRYRRKLVKDGKGRAFYAVLGIAAALPVFLVVFLLLVSADAVFRDMTRRFLEKLQPLDILQAVFMTAFMFFAAYCILSYVCGKHIKEEVKDTRSGEPILAITVTGLLTLLYLVFCGIQVAYLFLGQMQLPQGYTYAQYAREGFFQLLAVSLLNLVIVLSSLYFFKNNIILKIVLTVMSLCTFIMIASSALRMVIYIRYYYLTFLRIFVLWSLLVLFLLFVGITTYIFRRNFPLFRYGSVVITVCFLALSFCHPDYWIARVNTANIEGATQENRSREMEGDGFFLGEAYSDYRYLAGLCSDAAPVLLTFISQMEDDIPAAAGAGEDIMDAANAWRSDREGFSRVYLHRISSRTEKDSWRHFNISRYMARRKLEEAF